MPNIQPISILREKKVLDKMSESKHLSHYKSALEREQELHDLIMKVNESRDSIKAGKFYSEKNLIEW